jgi:hypothetical protein
MYFQNIQHQPANYFINFYMTRLEHFKAYNRCKEAVKVFRFLVSPSNLLGAYSNVQTALPDDINLCIISG